MAASSKYNGKLDRFETIATTEESIGPKLDRILAMDSDDAERRVYDAYATLINSHRNLGRMIKRAGLIRTEEDSYDARVIGMIVGLVQLIDMRPPQYSSQVQSFLATVLAYVSDANEDIADADVSSANIDNTLAILHLIEKMAMLCYEPTDDAKSATPDDSDY